MPGQVGCLDPLVFRVTESMKKSAAAGWVSSIAATINTSTAKSPSSLPSPGHRRRSESAAISVARPYSSRLNHPNIATTYDFDTQEGQDFLVMEYTPGVTLNEKLADACLRRFCSEAVHKPSLR